MSFQPVAKTPEERYALLRSVGEECVQESELLNLVEKKPNMRCYDGFEPSGSMHIAQGIFKAINVNKCTSCGCTFVFWLADWFAMMNDKVGGEVDKIHLLGEYFIEVWKITGMNMGRVEFLWTSEEVTKHAQEYWKLVLDIGRLNTIARIKKCCTIMGKTEGSLTGAQVLYPLMQCSDIFFLRADICQLGMDQRKVNMLAREYCDMIGRKLKPVILSHHMLSGLKQGQAKMSKSDPDSAIFVEDSAEDVARKVRQAYCPRVARKVVKPNDEGDDAVAGREGDRGDTNPILDYYEYIVFAMPDGKTTIAGRTFASYAELETSFLDGTLSEEQMKENLIEVINSLLDPVRHHFASNARARELLEKVKSLKKGRAPPQMIAVPPPPPQPHACVWLPATLHLPLDIANGILLAIEAFRQEHPSATVTLLLPDWTALACNEISGQERDIVAALQYYAALLKAYGLPPDVKVVRESEFALGQFMDFASTVINVGRRNSLHRIEQLFGELKNAGQVVASLMRAADAILLKVSHIINTSYDGVLSVMAEEFTNGAIRSVQAPESGIPSLRRPDENSNLPQQSKHNLNRDDVLYLDDNDMDIARKIKRAYAAPNEFHNPITAVAIHFLSKCGALEIKRADANGGDITYTSPETLQADCQSGALHPSDLKAMVTQQLQHHLKGVRAAVATPELKKLAQILKNAETKLGKK